jgi:hypothetical protein
MKRVAVTPKKHSTTLSIWRKPEAHERLKDEKSHDPARGQGQGSGS